MSIQKVPGWGKTVGILMIIFGSFGIFYQMYRMIFPKIMSFQRNVIERVYEFPEHLEYNDSTMTKEEVQELIEYPLQGFEEVNNVFFNFSDQVITYLTWVSLLMIVVCVFYVIAGAKLLKPKPENYKLARIILIVSLIVNLLSYILIFSEPGSFMLYMMMLYSFIGAIADLVLLIIMQTSDKSAYFNTNVPVQRSEDFDL